MTYTIQIKKGQLNVEKALENMDYDVVKFESELKMFADHQKPKLKKKILGQYITYMRGCGFKLDARSIGKTVPEEECSICVKPKPKTKPKPEITPKITVKPENKPETTPEMVVAEVAAQVETQKEEVPETSPQTPQFLEPEKISETPKTPQAETAKTNTANPNATAYFTFPDANLFKKLYEAMCILVSEITWKISKDGIAMRQMDPSRVAMIDLTIKKEDFEEWNITTPGLVAFDAGYIKKTVFAKPFQKGTSIAIKIDGETNKISFVIKDNRIRERSFSTLEASEEDVPTPKIAFHAKYKIIAKQIAEDIKELNGLSDHMIIIGTSESLQLKAEGDCGKGETTYTRGDENLLDIQVNEESKATFSFSYLKDFIQPALSEMAILEFSTDMPLKVTLLTKFGELKYYVAPRISCD